ncbi:MAG: universal stress protein [Bacillota bacterium]
MARDKVLLLIDNTSFSERAAAFTVKLLKANENLSATLLFAVNNREILPDVPGAGLVSKQELLAFFQEEAERAFRRALAVFQAEGFGVKTLVDYGDPVEVVTRLVEQEGYCLLVLGGKETDNRLNYILSSNAYRLSNLLDIPMVIVK